MSDGALFKPERDYTKEADKVIPEAQELAKHDIQKAIDKILVLEKQARQSSDLASTSRSLVAIVTICKEAGDWSLLNEQVLLLSKKHGQLKQAITKMVQVVMGFLDDAPHVDVKLSTIEALRTVTEGKLKIFVEVERARVTRMLSDIKKSQGNLKEAADILCELQVETFGSMARREKTEFILQQVELCVEKGDFTQAGILSRKIGTKFFARKPKKTPEQIEADRKATEEAEKKRSPDDPPTEKEDDVTDLKLKYYEQQITLAKQEDKYLEVCKHYRQVLDTESVEENPEQLRAVLQRVIYFILLAPYDNEQSDLLHRIQQDSRISQVSEEASLLKLFTVHELMRWPMVDEQFGPHLCSSDIFSKTKPATGASSEEAKAYSRYVALRNRVIEHNVRVVAKYYTRITFPRLTALLDLSEEETEKYISDLVCKKTVYARIDRPARIVNFEMKRGPDEVLDEWSGSMKSLLGLLERVGHLMQKEEMMARIQPGASEKAGRAGSSRHFSSTPSKRVMQELQAPKDLIQRQLENKKSRRVEMKDMSGSRIPGDIGIIPQTFVRPPNSEMPRLFGSTWKTRLKLEWLWIRTRVENFGSLLYFLWFMQRNRPASQRMPFDLRLRPAIALNLHKEVYTSLASGDLPILSKLICSGLATKLTTIVSRRSANELPPQSWKLIRYTSPLRIPFNYTLFSVRIPFTSVVLRPSLLHWPLTSLLPGTQAKIMSDRVVPLPMGDHIYLRQCIVRIRSLQSLDKGDGNSPAVADLTEYLVMQQLQKEEDEPATWKMWGTTKALTRQEMEKMVSARTVAAQSQGRLTFMDRLKALIPMRG